MVRYNLGGVLQNVRQATLQTILNSIYRLGGEDLQVVKREENSGEGNTINTLKPHTHPPKLLAQSVHGN